MKVLHCIAQFPGMTGSGIYFRHVLKGFEDAGFQNAALYAEQEGLLADLPEATTAFPVPFKSPTLPFPIAGMSDEMPYESTVYSQMSSEQYDLWIAAFRRRLEEVKQNFQPDCVVTHHIFILTSLVREVFDDIPVLAISHGTDIRQVKMNPWIQEQYIHQVQQLDRVFALSPSDADRLKEIFGIAMDCISVTGGGFDASVFRPDSKQKDGDEPYVLLFSGKISHAKGVYELARAFPKILDQEPNCKLQIVGNASEEQKARILSYAEATEKVHFHPAVSQEKYVKFLQEADIYFLPSYYEGIALSSIEALATQTRVVMSENDNLSWLLGSYVNRSGVIDYIDLPRLKNIDTPLEEDIPDFVDRIAEAGLKQIRRTKLDRQADRSTWSDVRLKEAIHTHSWKEIVDEILLAAKQAI